jgi:hypothetical protein
MWIIFISQRLISSLPGNPCNAALTSTDATDRRSLGVYRAYQAVSTSF